MKDEFDSEYEQNYLDNYEIDEDSPGCQVCKADLPEDQLVEYEGIFMCEECLDEARRLDEKDYIQREYDDEQDSNWDY